MRPGTTKKTSNQSPGYKKPTPEQNDPRNPAKKNNWKHRPFHVQHPPAHLPGDVRRQGHHFVGDPAVNLTAVNLTKSHGLEFIKWVGWEAWCDSPANTGEQKKNRRLTKCVPQVYVQAPNPIIL